MDQGFSRSGRGRRRVAGRIVVGVDGSEGSRRALRWAIGQAAGGPAAQARSAQATLCGHRFRRADAGFLAGGSGRPGGATRCGPGGGRRRAWPRLR
ncbi:MAG: universal stress protein [Micromonosporaceae bacterium]